MTGACCHRQIKIRSRYVSSKREGTVRSESACLLGEVLHRVLFIWENATSVRELCHPLTPLTLFVSSARYRVLFRWDLYDSQVLDGGTSGKCVGLQRTSSLGLAGRSPAVVLMAAPSQYEAPRVPSDKNFAPVQVAVSLAKPLRCLLAIIAGRRTSPATHTYPVHTPYEVESKWSVGGPTKGTLTHDVLSAERGQGCTGPRPQWLPHGQTTFSVVSPCKL